MVDDLIEPLEKAINNNKAAKEAVTAPAAAAGSSSGNAAPLPDMEKFIEQLRSFLRLVNTLNKMEDVSGKLRWQDFMARLQKKPLVSEVLTETQQHDIGDIVM